MWIKPSKGKEDEEQKGAETSERLSYEKELVKKKSQGAWGTVRPEGGWSRQPGRCSRQAET
jgi:hypothetical protein